MHYKDEIFSADELKGQEVAEYQFVNCRFIGTNLRFSSFTNCEFRSCDLSSILSDMTSFENCRFPESKLNGLDFAEIQLKQCNFTAAVMKNCIVQQMKAGCKNEKKKFDLSHTAFDEAELSGTIFFWCELRNASFQHANLENVVFDRCDLKQANFTSAITRGTNFTDSKIENTILNVEGFLAFGNSKGFVLEQSNTQQEK